MNPKHMRDWLDDFLFNNDGLNPSIAPKICDDWEKMIYNPDKELTWEEVFTTGSRVVEFVVAMKPLCRIDDMPDELVSFIQSAHELLLAFGNVANRAMYFANDVISHSAEKKENARRTKVLALDKIFENLDAAELVIFEYARPILVKMLRDYDYTPRRGENASTADGQ